MEIVQGPFDLSEIKKKKKKACYSFPAEQAMLMQYPLNISELQVLMD